MDSNAKWVLYGLQETFPGSSWTGEEAWSNQQVIVVILQIEICCYESTSQKNKVYYTKLQLTYPLILPGFLSGATPNTHGTQVLENETIGRYFVQ